MKHWVLTGYYLPQFLRMKAYTIREIDVAGPIGELFYEFCELFLQLSYHSAQLRDMIKTELIVNMSKFEAIKV